MSAVVKQLVRHPCLLKHRNFSLIVPNSRSKLIDTSAMINNLEREGVSAKEAQLLTTAMNEKLDTFFLKEAMNQDIKLLEADISAFEVNQENSKEHLFRLLKCEMEDVQLVMQGTKGLLLSRFHDDSAKTTGQFIKELQVFKVKLEACKSRMKVSLLVSALAVCCFAMVKLGNIVH